ncbi:MAG: FAD-dependent oxidoreductase [Lachnospiraceae bacterium]|nr:FAD-dependent oxidoreductase [Lachnospiraceae bacterium]MDY5497733.1 FAD-dependent oxidoreductase [Anaerobutyricum sp.]
MIRIAQIKLKIDHSPEELYEAIVHQAHGKRPKRWEIVRKSVDARKKPQLFYVYTIDAEFEEENKILSFKKSRWTPVTNAEYSFPYQNTIAGFPKKEEDRPVIIGAGPAGLFAGLVLARAGFCPVIFERGDCVEKRAETVEEFFSGNPLDEESNVQFGEGGAGTFSDGKLNTLVKDKFGRNRFVLQEFVKHGAPWEILYEAKPHIGTDLLKNVVVSIRKEIQNLGGTVFFRTKVVDLMQEKGRIVALLLEKEGKKQEYPCRNVIFAIGHSARDTFYMLEKKNLFMTPKAFAIGVRVEHPAALINESQYGKEGAKRLPAASYKLTHQCKSTGRGIYSFCMCPGGYVVNSSSEKGRLCVNGMSYHDRAGQNSNTALVTTVTPEDFPSKSPLAGLEFQRKYEELAFLCGDGKIPVQLYGDFLEEKTSAELGSVIPQTKGAWQFANLRECLPEYICASIIEGMDAFGNKIRGYDGKDTILSGVEARTSSPVRMERNKDFEGSIEGLFPCGEGAGYAGGITSAAMDGIKTAEALAAKLLMR